MLDCSADVSKSIPKGRTNPSQSKPYCSPRDGVFDGGGNDVEHQKICCRALVCFLYYRFIDLVQTLLRVSSIDETGISMRGLGEEGESNKCLVVIS